MPMRSAGIVLAFSVLAVLAGCGPERTKTVPDELVGVWRTTDPKYADRFLELTKTTISFGTGGQDSYTRTVVAVEKRRGNGDTLYTVVYVDPQGEYKFSLYYEAVGGGLIRYKNQKGIAWTRQRGALAAQPQRDDTTAPIAPERRVADKGMGGR